ncbi:MAG: glycosyltransferase family 4 protein [bacterium]|nr:glycosyltransferase family 4 protein [bacterium]
MTAAAPRVLLFGTEFPPSAAGTAVYARCLALALHGCGAEVAMLTQAPAGNTFDDAELPVPVTRIPYTGNVPLRYHRTLEALRRQLAQFQPDCLWTTNGMATRIAALTPGLTCPLITCARGSDIRTRLPASNIWRYLEGLLQRRAYGRSAGIAAACNDLRSYAITRGIDGRKLFISHSAFDFGRLDGLAGELADIPREPTTLLTVARLTQQKRVDVLLRSVALATGDVPGLRFVIVGDGPERSRLEALAGALHIADRVRFTGSLRPFSVDLYSEYQRATAFALTSVGEGLANVFIEAGAFHLPSLGSNSGGTPEILTNNVTGYLVRPDDPQNTATRIVALMKDPDRSRKMGVAARRWVEREFGLQPLGERSLAVIRAVIAGDAVPRLEMNR